MQVVGAEDATPVSCVLGEWERRWLRHDPRPQSFPGAWPESDSLIGRGLRDHCPAFTFYRVQKGVTCLELVTGLDQKHSL